MSIYFIFSSISGGWRLPYIAIDFFPGSTFQKTALRFTGISPWLPQAEDSRHESITYRGILHDNISGWFKGLFFSRNYCFFFLTINLGVYGPCPWINGTRRNTSCRLMPFPQHLQELRSPEAQPWSSSEVCCRGVSIHGSGYPCQHLWGDHGEWRSMFSAEQHCHAFA